MYKVTYQGRPYGQKYQTAKAAAEAYVRLSESLQGLGWKKC